jgi:uncharacterized integral membrane protein
MKLELPARGRRKVHAQPQQCGRSCAGRGHIVKVRNGGALIVAGQLSLVVVFYDQNTMTVTVTCVVVRMDLPARQPCCDDHPS